jgi:peroxin-1
MIEKPLKYSSLFKKLPIKLSRGILLYGGSGTGKTAIGESLADEFMMKYFSVKCSDILNKYIGESEAAVRDIFEKAMSVSPSIIFFDEFETIVPRRNSSNTGVTDRVVNQFLCYLDGVASVEGVYIVAATSRPELIDPALLRPGRIDTKIFLDYPSEA